MSIKNKVYIMILSLTVIVVTLLVVYGASTDDGSYYDSEQFVIDNVSANTLQDIAGSTVSHAGPDDVALAIISGYYDDKKANYIEAKKYEFREFVEHTRHTPRDFDSAKWILENGKR